VQALSLLILINNAEHYPIVITKPEGNTLVADANTETTHYSGFKAYVQQRTIDSPELLMPFLDKPRPASRGFSNANLTETSHRPATRNR